ncbi:ABC transporter substrate-binding protein [Egbenema bharatensis]|uniref:ABC transporter substrate-binding protein n=1 Tax=Egbenema bharatensis TaxID=3463334 RepID=UPI003A83CF97
MNSFNVRDRFSLPRRRFLWLGASTCLATLTANCARNQQAANPESAIDFTTASWEEIVAAARGTTVNWAMWGGSDQTNRYADQWVGARLSSEYDVTLNRVPLNDTVEAVNKVIGEVQAGLTTGGNVDLIWINGENFRTMKQGNLLFGPFNDALPALQYYDRDNPAVTTDFGLPIEGYSAPYTGSYYVMVMDRARVTQAPQTFEELMTWAGKIPPLCLCGSTCV